MKGKSRKIRCAVISFLLSIVMAVSTFPFATVNVEAKSRADAYREELGDYIKVLAAKNGDIRSDEYSNAVEYDTGFRTKIDKKYNIEIIYTEGRNTSYFEVVRYESFNIEENESEIEFADMGFGLWNGHNKNKCSMAYIWSLESEDEDTDPVSMFLTSWNHGMRNMSLNNIKFKPGNTNETAPTSADKKRAVKLTKYLFRDFNRFLKNELGFTAKKLGFESLWLKVS